MQQDFPVTRAERILYLPKQGIDQKINIVLASVNTCVYKITSNAKKKVMIASISIEQKLDAGNLSINLLINRLSDDAPTFHWCMPELTWKIDFTFVIKNCRNVSKAGST